MVVNPFIKDPDFFDRKIRSMWFTGRGMRFDTHGDGGGLQGVWNLTGQVKGIYDAPVKTTWKSGAFQEGSTQRAVKRLHRDMLLGFGIVETPGRGAEDNESDFRSIFEYEVDEYDDDPEPTTLHVDTDRSGERRLDVLMYDTPESEPDIDPMDQQYFELIMKVRAGQPNWYELDPATGKDYTTTFSAGSASAEGFIEVYNPTDLDIRQDWILTRAQWNIPDVSWKGAKTHRRPGGQWGGRIIPMNPITDIQGGARISLDGSKLMVRDNNYTNALPVLLPNNMRFMHKIPAYTQRQVLPISYTGAPAGGAMAKLVTPRRWSRPWGLEL